MKPDWASRFYIKVFKNGPLHPVLKTRCHIWVASKFVQGYGQFRIGGRCGGKLHRAHRVAWFLAHGSWPRPNALHKCDNPACVRVDHLFEGDHQANATDKMSKGRCNSPKGELHWGSKLGAPQVREIRKLHATGRFTYEALASKYFVDRTQISNIVRRVSWKHIP